MSLVTRKPVFGVCDQVSLKAACSASETSWRLEIYDIETQDIILSSQRTRKALIILRGCAGWSAPLLFAFGKTGFTVTWLKCDGWTDSAVFHLFQWFYQDHCDGSVQWSCAKVWSYNTSQYMFVCPVSFLNGSVNTIMVMLSIVSWSTSEEFNQYY